MPISTTAPFTALEVLNWSPSDWQIRLPPELSYLVERQPIIVADVAIKPVQGALYVGREPRRYFLLLQHLRLPLKACLDVRRAASAAPSWVWWRARSRFCRAIGIGSVASLAARRSPCAVWWKKHGASTRGVTPYANHVKRPTAS